MFKNYKVIILFNFLITTSFSFVVNLYFGFSGIHPLDDFLNFNCGYRILSGDIPYQSYYSITGSFLCILQAYFYEYFGINWLSFVAHASIFNLVLSVVLFFFLKKFKTPNYIILLLCFSISMLGYPNNGVPGVDHHSWIMSICSFLMFYAGMYFKEYKFIILSVILLFFAFLTKQVPAAYFLLLIFSIYIFFFIKDKKFYFFYTIILTVCFCIFILLLFFYLNSIDLKIFINQHFLLAIKLGASRFENVNFAFLREKISSIYFVIFLIFPLMINFYFFYKKNKNFFIKEIVTLDFYICFGLIFICFIYELHTNNSAMTFLMLPVIIFFIFKIENNLIFTKKFNLNYIYFFLILLCLFKLIQYKPIYFFISLPLVIYLNKLKKNSLKIKNFLFIYLIFSTIYYFDTSIVSRKYKDLDNKHEQIIFKGDKINYRFDNLKWNTSYKLSEAVETEYIFNLKKLLKKINRRFILISDYQIFNILLEYKDYSPVKYWHTNVSYPGKNSEYRKEFEIFFKNKILENYIGYIIIDSRASVFTENIEDFKFLKKCSTRIETNLNSAKIYRLDNLCIKNYIF